MANRKIIVPTDFTRVSEVALEHAQAVAKATDSQVYVLHIVEHKKNLAEARLKLEHLKTSVKESLGLEIETIGRIGNIYEDIDSVAVEMDAALIIMGTHGMKGMQFITGSRALRIVTSSSVPFIITQEAGVGPNAYDDIMVPLDLHKETKQKLNLAAKMAHYFKSRVHLISPGEKDEYLRNQLDRNITFAKKFFEEEGLECTTKIANSESETTGFVNDVVSHAQNVTGDLIAIMNIADNSLFSIFGTNYAQKMIENEAQIPVMVLNPVETHITTYGFFGGYTPG
ncbi:MAG: universal stress protein [Flavobacteriales bacterium]